MKPLRIFMNFALLLATSPAGSPTRAQAAMPLSTVPVQIAGSAVVNFADLARQEALKPPHVGPPVPVIQPEGEEPPEPAAPPPGTIKPPVLRPAPVRRPAAASPSPALSYAGLDDIADSNGFIYVPPDTDGVVGLSKVMEGLNNGYRTRAKSTGVTSATLSLSAFWGSADSNPVSSFYDPRTLYDPINSRFIVVVLSGPNTTTSRIDVGVSNTSDPDGTYTLFSVVADGTGATWADFPTVGFNKNWIAINVNMFTVNASPAYSASKMLILDYASLRSGSLVSTFATGTGFCSSPSATYSPTESTLYVPTHLSSASGTYRLDTITGTPGSPVYTVGATKLRGLTWVQPSGNILPQSAPVSGSSSCGATPCKIESQDAQIRSTPVVRGGLLYYSQTVGATALAHTMVQWTVLDASGGGTTGNVVDGGRVEDATATATNGGKWYAYPHIAVNQHLDIILGFTEFSSAQHPAAGYSVHKGTDVAGLMNDPFIYQPGSDYYHKDFGSGRNRFGDYSKAQVDPSNDDDLWVLTEWAKARPGTDDGTTGSNSSRWGTYWAKIAKPSPVSLQGFELD